MSRAEALERYRELALPTTAEESWRFTDLRGFDPDAFTGSAASAATGDFGSLLDLDVAGFAQVTEGGLSIESAPEGIRFEALDESHELLGGLVGPTDKLTAQNAAQWRHGLLVHVPRGVEVEKPLYVRIG
ncbi:MAG: hypothetical protein KY396_00555, partial [Actinobacteria bacterium]|nr:hypothetical protein [Actinomycetota bacterium]